MLSIGEGNVVHMMVSLDVYVRRGRRVLRRALANPRLHALAQSGGCLLAGFFMAAASLGSSPQPLALGLVCAASGWPALLLGAGSMLGYGIFWGGAGTQCVVWVMAGLLAAVLLGGRELLRQSPLLMPALSGLIVAAAGLFFQVRMGDTTPVAMYLLRIALAALSTLLFSMAAERRDPLIDWAVCALGVLALAQVAPISYLSLGFVAGAALSCVGALPAAAMAGLALDLAQITPVPMTAVLSLAYLLRLLPLGRGKWRNLTPAAVFLPVMALGGVWDLHPLPGLVLGGAVALLIPKATDLSRRRGETGVAQVQLEMVSGVLEQARQLLEDLDEPPIDEPALIARAAERACSGCPCRKNCKEKPDELPTQLLHKPLGNGADLPLACRKSGRLLGELRHSQEQLRSIRADRDRRLEYRGAVVQQYGFLSEYMQAVADSLARRKEPPAVWFRPEIAVCSASRERSNGDRCLWFAGVECRYYIALCDGMGTGEEAAAEGKRNGEILRRLLTAGYPPEHALRTVNSLCALRGQAGAVTVDLAELRLDTGKATVYKWGAAPSYLITRGEPVKIGTATPPPGLSALDGQETVERLSLRRGETLVLLSDGAGGEESLRYAWERAGEPAGELAAKILELADGSDDATVAVVRLNPVGPGVS